MVDYATVSIPAFTLAGISRRTSNNKPEEIGALWQSFYKNDISSQIAAKKSDAVYSLYIDYEGDHTKPYTLVIGHLVEPEFAAPSGLVVKTVPAAKYAVFSANGPQPATLIAAWQRIWNLKLPRTYSGDFDLFSGDQVTVHVAID
ncbi:MAG TPA: GyrI-like domain-containing protein [Terriglobales bacterium]|jgi:predicted transcriptional regulator YdeE